MTMQTETNFVKSTIAQSTFAFFNPIDLFDSKLTSPVFKARVLGSYAWAIDTTIINKARQVFFKLREEADVSSRDNDAYNEFINGLSEMNAGDLYAADLGYEQNAGTLRQIAMLLGLSRAAHDRAQSASTVAELAYEQKSFEQLIKDEKPYIDHALIAEEAHFEASTIMGEAMDANPHSAEYQAIYDAAVKDALEADSSTAADRVRESQRIRPAVLRVIDSVARLGDTDDVEFHQLDNALQIQLINRARKIGNSVYNQIRTWRSLAGERSMIRIENYHLAKEFDAVLSSPKFNEGQRASDNDDNRTRSDILAAADA